MKRSTQGLTWYLIIAGAMLAVLTLTAFVMEADGAAPGECCEGAAPDT